ncbi:MAG TPA: hypothetical protein VJJ22_01605 [Candidatus Paceibacterota bacterium]
MSAEMVFLCREAQAILEKLYLLENPECPRDIVSFVDELCQYYNREDIVDALEYLDDNEMIHVGIAPEGEPFIASVDYDEFFFLPRA